LSDSFKVEAVVGVPKDLSMEKKFPFVIYNRGGRKDFGKLQDCGILTMNSLFKNDSRYILLAPQLRGTSGSEGIDEYGGAEINDVHSLYRIAQSIAFVDSSSAFLVGWSRGGMTSYLAIKQGLRFNAAAVLAGIPDLLAVDKKRPDMQKVFDETIPKISSDRKKALQSRSAIYWPEKITTPLLLIHGVKDDKAPIESFLNL
jgi:dipeptidyl aminopeptidase/acylaminoacyl peptidase